MDRRFDNVLSVLGAVLVPLVEADGGEVFLVSADADTLIIHLAGRRAGAPGNTIIRHRVFEPAIHAVAPQIKVVLQAGSLVPAGAKRIAPEHPEAAGTEASQG
jgi:Fe-S cluster biogenesis protein NfuA